MYLARYLDVAMEMERVATTRYLMTLASSENIALLGGGQRGGNYQDPISSSMISGTYKAVIG